MTALAIVAYLAAGILTAAALVRDTDMLEARGPYGHPLGMTSPFAATVTVAIWPLFAVVGLIVLAGKALTALVDTIASAARR